MTDSPGTDVTTTTTEGWLTPGVAGIGAASLRADVGHEIPTALLPSLLTATLAAPASGHVGDTVRFIHRHHHHDRRLLGMLLRSVAPTDKWR